MVFFCAPEPYHRARPGSRVVLPRARPRPPVAPDYRSGRVRHNLLGYDSRVVRWPQARRREVGRRVADLLRAQRAHSVPHQNEVNPFRRSRTGREGVFRIQRPGEAVVPRLGDRPCVGEATGDERVVSDQEQMLDIGEGCRAIRKEARGGHPPKTKTNAARPRATTCRSTENPLDDQSVCLIRSGARRDRYATGACLPLRPLICKTPNSRKLLEGRRDDLRPQ
jgi:hypothetical protein